MKLKLKIKTRQKSDVAAELIKERLNVILSWAIGLLLATVFVIVLGLTYAHLDDHLSEKTTIQNYSRVTEKSVD